MSKNNAVNNVLIGGLVSGLFVASAFQCAPKKRSSSSETVKMVDMASASQCASKKGRTSETVKTVDKEDLLLIKALGRALSVLVSADVYKNFLNQLGSEPKVMRSISWNSEYGKYCKACSLVWNCMIILGRDRLTGNLERLGKFLNSGALELSDQAYQREVSAICRMDTSTLKVDYGKYGGDMQDTFELSVTAMQDFFRKSLKVRHFQWCCDDPIGQLTYFLATIEYMLEYVLFGRGQWSNLKMEGNNLLSQLVQFYKGDRSFEYRNFASMNFNDLSGQVEKELKKFGGIQLV